VTGYTVWALDEFGRLFSCTEVVSDFRMTLAYFNVNLYVFETCCRQILREMGTAAFASWEGEMWEVEWDLNKLELFEEGE